ncbi:hypothetical protein SLEP1_g9493 [Rubroshorea leprosula]|uniref:Uncharacterized protein n=1 Tax=Rubroshorea leprosula TaxID=152421 RepID=A0AAV5IB35_9ROSI|nr:hypothetical protein SLEP1_g9493 [Rubroshorea leprosula]
MHKASPRTTCIHSKTACYFSNYLKSCQRQQQRYFQRT